MKTIKAKLAAAACIGFLCVFAPALAAFAAGTLSIALSSNDAKIGDTVTVTVYAAGADNAAVTADMNITYDTSKLEYVSSSASGAAGGGGTVKVSGSDVSIKFKAVGSGDAYVKAEGAALTAAGAHIAVSGTAAAGDDAPEAAKSGDNSLSALTISNGTLSPAFKGSITEYTAEVGADVTEIQVNPVLSNSKAQVVSVTGNQGLKTGKNVITILVKAENGTEASYKITVTKGEGTAAPDNNETPSGETDGQKPQETDGTQNDPAVTGAETIVIDGVNYAISEAFTDEDIPEGFSRADFEYKGAPHQGIIFDSGHLGMYYLSNDAGESKFFIYDADRDKFYPYVRLSSGEHFIVLMVVPNGVIPPDNYEETTLAIKEGVNIAAYQYAGDEDTEIVKLETEDGEVSDGISDFYIFYGMDATGVSCWYQYDVKQGTYQRFNEAATGSSGPTESYETLAKSYQELDERQKETKTKDRRMIAILIFVAVVLLIVIVNLLLKIRDLKTEDDDGDYGNLPAKPEKLSKARKPEKPAKISKPAKPVKPDKPVKAQKQEENPYFYGDDDDMMDDFEDEPGVLSKRPKKKEKPLRKPALAKPEPVTLDEEDDIEFIDLNDL